jgi:hypothetical protein
MTLTLKLKREINDLKLAQLEFESLKMPLISA